MNVSGLGSGVAATTSHAYFIDRVTNSANLTPMLWFFVTFLSVAFR